MSNSFWLFVLLGTSISLRAQTVWNGSISDQWSNSANWTPASVPGAGDQVVLSSTTPNPLRLTANQNIQSLTVSDGLFDLNGFQLDVSGATQITGGTIHRGTIVSAQFSQISQANFTGHIHLIKDGTSVNTWDGGNHFDTLTVEKTTNSRIRMGSLFPDTVTGPLQVVNTGANPIELAYQASGNLFLNQLTLTSTSGGGGVTIGQAGGTSTVASGAALASNMFNSGILEILNLQQLGGQPNGTFSVSQFVASNSQLSGAITVSSANSITLTNASFLASSNLEGSNLVLNGSNSFSTDSGTTILTKTGTGTNLWNGGNRFGNTTIQILTNGNIQTGVLQPDTFLNDLTLFSATTGDFYLAESSFGNYFGGDVVLSGPGLNDYYIGRLGGTSTMPNGRLLSLNQNASQLQINHLTQTTALDHGAFVATDIRIHGSSLLGGIELTASDDLFLDSVWLYGTNRLHAEDINFTNKIYLSQLPDTTFLTKSSLASNTSQTTNGSMVAANLVVRNESAYFLRFAGATPDTVLGFLHTEIIGSGDISFAYASAGNFVQGPVQVDNPGTGRLYFGQNNGSTSQGPTAFSTIDTSFARALYFRNYTQTTGGGAFVAKTESFYANNVVFDTDFNVETDTGNANFDIQIINGQFFGKSFFASGADFTLSGNNAFGIHGDSVLLKKGPFSGANDSWNGPTLFGGPTTIHNASNNLLRSAVSQPDTFLSSLLVLQTANGSVRLSESSPGNLYQGNISLQNVGPGEFSFGRNSGTSSMGPYDFSTVGTFMGNRVDLNNFSQAIGGTGNLSIETDLFFGANLSLRGSISVETDSSNSANDITLNNILVQGSASFLSGADLSIGGTATFTSLPTDSLQLGIGPSASSNVNWTGGLNVVGHTTVVNNSIRNLSMATAAPDTFQSGITLRNLGGGTLRFANNASGNLVNGPMALESTSGGAFSIGLGGGTTDLGPFPLTSIDTLETTNFQISNLSHALGGTGQIQVNALNIVFQDAQMQIDLFAQTDTGGPSNEITFNHVEIAGNVTAIAGADLFISNGLTVSTLPTATAYFSQGPSANNVTNSLNGGIYAGGEFTFENYSAQTIRFANAGVADTFNGGLILSNLNNGNISFAQNGAGHLVNGDFEINNSAGAGGVNIGSGNGTTTHQNGELRTGTGYFDGTLTWNNLTQAPSATTNFTATPNTVNMSSVQLNGNFSGTTTPLSAASDIVLNTVAITGNVLLSSAADLQLNGANQFATDSGTSVTLVQGALANTASNWPGGNTFGNLSLTNNSTQNLRMANTTGDDLIGNANFSLLGSGLIQFAHNGNSSLAGDLIVSGNSALFQINSGTGNLTFDGDSAQTFDGPPGFEFSVTTFEMNGDGRLKLDKPLRVLGTLQMTKGILETDSINMIILEDESVTSTIGSDSAFISGPMQYVMNSGSSARSTLLFPIGKDSSWHPVQLEVSHTNGTSYTYQAEVFNQDASVVGWVLPVDSSITHVSTERLYTINRFLTATMTNEPSAGLRGGGSSPRITLYYDSTDFVPDPLDLRIVKSNNTGFWENLGGFGSAPGSGFITSSGTPSPFTSFSDFSFGNGPGGVNPLPITLVEFTAQPLGEKVELKWTTESEINNAYFTVERSANLKDWETVAQQAGAGNSNQILHYQDLDEQPLPGTSYYRLKQTDFDGSFSLSNAVAVNFDAQQAPWSVYPNPSQGPIYLQRSQNVATEAELMDLSGRVLHRWQLPASGETQILHMPSLPGGLYLLRIDGTVQRLVRY